MTAPKGMIEIRFDDLLPGEEFFLPENTNERLMKRKDGRRCAKVDPVVTVPLEKTVYIHRSDSTQALDDALMNLMAATSNINACMSKLRKARGEDVKEETPPAETEEKK